MYDDDDPKVQRSKDEKNTCPAPGMVTRSEATSALPVRTTGHLHEAAVNNTLDLLQSVVPKVSVLITLLIHIIKLSQLSPHNTVSTQ